MDTSPLDFMHLKGGHGSRFIVVTFYDDFLAGQHAMETYQRMICRFQADYTFKHQLWRIDLLQDRGMGALLAEEVNSADMIIVSLHKPHLAVEFREWMETWTSRSKSQKRVLVAVFDHPTVEVTMTESSLRDFASRKGMDFISNKTTVTAADVSDTGLTDRAFKTSSVLENILHRPSYQAFATPHHK